MSTAASATATLPGSSSVRLRTSLNFMFSTGPGSRLALSSITSILRSRKWVAERLQPGDHLCGVSYGGLVSLFAAARATNLGSLTVIEPPAFALAEDRPDVAALVERLKHLWSNGPSEPRAFLLAFRAEVGGNTVEFPDPLPLQLYQGAQILMVERGPWEAQPPLEALHDADYPKLVISGGWSAAFNAVCDVLEDQLGAERAVIPGRGHTPQFLGQPFNDILRDFIHRAST